MKFWIFTGGAKNELFHLLMSDLEKKENVTLVGSLPEIPKGRQKLWKLHHNVKLNQKAPLPFRSIWYPYMPFEESVLKEGQHCLIFNNVSAGFFEPGLLRKWKNNYQVKLVFYFLDVYQSYYAREARLFVKQVPFDRIYSFYQEDVKAFGFHYLDCYYSKLDSARLSSILSDSIFSGSTLPGSSADGQGQETQEASFAGTENQKYDVFFWGTDGGRRSFVEAAAGRLGELGLSAKMGICYTDAEANDKGAIDTPAQIQMIYNQPIGYPEVVRNLWNCDVILDVVGGYSKGVSLRYFESFAYQKKLITNNPLVREMRGFDPDRMLVIGSPSEITKEFFERPAPEGYQDQFSPLHFIEELEREL